MVLVLSILVAAGVLLIALAALRWWAARALEDVVQDEPAAPRTLPEGHRPPAGLTPLSPSERFLLHEAARGLRELQEYLAQAA